MTVTLHLTARALIELLGATNLFTLALFFAERVGDPPYSLRQDVSGSLAVALFVGACVVLVALGLEVAS